MREIKFRAWDQKKKRMNYGDDVIVTGGEVGYKPARGEFGILEINNYIEDDWMQYTGLKDKNGKEIYEGDILLDELNSKYKVYWNEGFASFMLENLSKGDLLYSRIVPGVKIIGNIYENPELIEKCENK